MFLVKGMNKERNEEKETECTFFGIGLTNIWTIMLSPDPQNLNDAMIFRLKVTEHL